MRRTLSSLTPQLRASLTILCGCLLALTVTQQASGKSSYAITPPQSWVRVVDLESGTQTGTGAASTTFLLDDHQIRVGQKTVDRYFHHVQKIETAAGLTDVSQLRFQFEPSYQKLAIHFIRIRREGNPIDALRPAEIKMIQQEEDLNQQLYNGTLAALVFLNDLRVGDIVDYAYTVSGENPVLGGRFAEILYLADRQPIRHLAFRLVCPSDRVLEIKNANIDLAPAVMNSGSETEYSWERREVDGIIYEGSVPDWFDPYPSVSVSEFRTWSDVAQWALPLYGTANPTPPELTSRIQKWQSDFESPEQRTVAALRFVQDEIRYLGIELGRYSHQPTLPAKVFARRFGDCKDKSLLLATVLRSMGVEASPALVLSSGGRSLDSKQPSPFAFDHVIVQAKLAGKTYWLDPTISYQRGGLDKYYDPYYERALVLREGVSGLEKIPLPTASSGHISVREKYDAKSSRGPVSLQVNTTYFGAEADAMRYQLSRDSLPELSKTYLNFYADENPTIKAEGLPEIEDDQLTNRIVVREKYLIDEFWKDLRHEFLAYKIYAEVGKPSVTQRTMPMRIRYPLSINHLIEINLGERYNIATDQGTISNDAIRFDYGFSTKGNAIKLEYTLKTFTDSVPLERVPQHLLVLDRIHNFVAFELTNGPGGGVRSPSRVAGGLANLIFGFVIVVPLIVIASVFLLRNRLKGRTKSQFAEGLKAKLGFAPETAIHVAHEADIDPALRNFKCGCGQSPYKSDSPPLPERFTYDGQHLIGIRLYCSSCRRSSDLYFRPRSIQPTDSPSPQPNY